MGIYGAAERRQRAGGVQPRASWSLKPPGDLAAGPLVGEHAHLAGERAGVQLAEDAVLNAVVEDGTRGGGRRQPSSGSHPNLQLRWCSIRPRPRSDTPDLQRRRPCECAQGGCPIGLGEQREDLRSRRWRRRTKSPDVDRAGQHNRPVGGVRVDANDQDYAVAVVGGRGGHGDGDNLWFKGWIQQRTKLADQSVHRSLRDANKASVAVCVFSHPDEHDAAIPIRHASDGFDDVAPIDLAFQLENAALGQRVVRLCSQHELADSCKVDLRRWRAEHIDHELAPFLWPTPNPMQSLAGACRRRRGLNTTDLARSSGSRYRLRDPA